MLNRDGGFDPAKELKSITLSLMESLANGMDKLNKEMFSGSDEGIDMLTNLIDGGKTMPDNWGPSGDPEIMHMIERAFYMTLIPIAVSHHLLPLLLKSDGVETYSTRETYSLPIYSQSELREVILIPRF